MSEHDMTDHGAGTPSNEQSARADRWTRIVKSAHTHNAESRSPDKDEADPQDSSRGHSGCH